MPTLSALPTDTAVPVDTARHHLSLDRDGRSSPRPDRWSLAARPVCELAIAARSGDTAAAGELYRRTCGRARRAASAFCRPDDIDDAVSEGLSRALQRIGQLRDPAAAESWMIRCVVRSAIDLSRQRSRQSLVATLHSACERPHSVTASAAEQALSVLERDAMAEVVRALPPQHRVVLELRYQAGLSVERIAATLGQPAGTVRRHCVEARQAAGQEFLSRHLQPASGACAQTTEILCQEPYRRPAIRGRRRAGEHLRRCPACRDRQDEVAAVLSELGYRRATRSS